MVKSHKCLHVPNTCQNFSLLIKEETSKQLRLFRKRIQNNIDMLAVSNAEMNL